MSAAIKSRLLLLTRRMEALAVKRSIVFRVNIHQDTKTMVFSWTCSDIHPLAHQHARPLDG